MNYSAPIKAGHVSPAPKENAVAKLRPLVVSVTEFRRLLGDIGKTLAFSLIRAGEVERVKIRGRTCVTLSSIESLIARSVGEPK